MTKKKRYRYYQGKPVKRMREGRLGIILTMLSPVKGVAGPQITIQQADWDRYGEWRELEVQNLDDIRRSVVA